MIWGLKRRISSSRVLAVLVSAHDHLDFAPSSLYMDAIRVARVEDVFCSKAGNTLRGTVHLTTHHLIFRYDESEKDEMWVPYPLVSLVTRLPQTMYGLNPLTIRTRTFETFTLSFKSEKDIIDVFESVKELTVATSITQLYAFFYTPNPPLEAKSGWSIYSPRTEFGRMGVGTRSKAWRFTDINKDYSFSPTYPSRLVVPTRISDTTLQYAVKYRSKGRIPVLTYLHWANFGSITRSSQPMVGLTSNRSVQDEKLIEAIFHTHRSPESHVPNGPVYGATTTNLIIDARPTTNAVANTAKGAGTENMDHYKDAKKAYLGIDNIHTMRDSLAKVVDALRETELIAASASGNVPGEGAAMPILDRQALRRSGWLRHLVAIMEGTLLIVKNVHVNSSHVLIHCSDGWDRTAQLSALSQICLDPFYRTIHGFQILVEKDWLSFGHKFLDRCGHLSSEKFFLAPTDNGNNPSGAEAAQAFFASVQNRFASQNHLKETSPVFHQFLESVRQVQRQFPERFEFNERFLRQLHHHLYSCQFGTFLCNTEKERRVGEGGPPVCDVTVSVWDFFNSAPEDKLNLNPDYDPSLDSPSRPKPDMGVLMINPKDVRFWNELYGRTDEEMNGRYVVKQAAAELPEFVAPIESAEEDPAILSGTPAIPSPSSTPGSPAGSIAALHRTGSPNPVSAAGITAVPLTSPSKTRHESLRPFDTGPLGSAFISHIPNSNPRSPSPSIRAPPSPRSSSAQPATADLLTAGASGVRSMWGKLSSNASAAFSVVQDTYGSVTQDIKGLSLGGGATGSPERAGGELKSREEISTWSGNRPSSPSRRSSTISYTIGRTTNPWTTNSTTRPAVPSMLVDNPWNSARSSPSELHAGLGPLGGDTPVRGGSQSRVTPTNPLLSEPSPVLPSHSSAPTSTGLFAGPLTADPIPLAVPSTPSELGANQWASASRPSQAQTGSESPPPRPPPAAASDPLGVGL
ncbi:phosphatases II [Cristinia sonorae]|uniref:Phosphatases II n=1 Tax=Cristinia sonorae TaxID=1940300 RepID=A0A8K0XUC7_9AGAR|nr:phosphatases II [Cristinia sonorae]